MGLFSTHPDAKQLQNKFVNAKSVFKKMKTDLEGINKIAEEEIKYRETVIRQNQEEVAKLQALLKENGETIEKVSALI